MIRDFEVIGAATEVKSEPIECPECHQQMIPPILSCPWCAGTKCLRIIKYPGESQMLFRVVCFDSDIYGPYARSAIAAVEGWNERDTTGLESEKRGEQGDGDD